MIELRISIDTVGVNFVFVICGKEQSVWLAVPRQVVGNLPPGFLTIQPYLSGAGRNSGFQFRNRSFPDIFAGSWFPVTVSLL
jgi:hypothetical protein